MKVIIIFVCLDDSYNTIAMSETFRISLRETTSAISDKEVIFISTYDFCSEIKNWKINIYVDNQTVLTRQFVFE
ncbi:MAG: hypothetical protein U9N62_02305 [Thermotogota bacterium]|nr:hypothetical protein [Thermotogota bacterium]